MSPTPEQEQLEKDALNRIIHSFNYQAVAIPILKLRALEIENAIDPEQAEASLRLHEALKNLIHGEDDTVKELAVYYLLAELNTTPGEPIAIKQEVVPGYG